MIFLTWLGYFSIGASLASHANLIADRMISGESFELPSRCPNCQFLLPLSDMIPIVSFLKLSGHCRYCQSQIPLHLFWFEWLGGLFFARLDLTKFADLTTGALFFFLLICAMTDSQDQTFEISCLFGPILIALFFSKWSWNQLNLIIGISWLLFIIVLLILVKTDRLGMGDLLWFLILSVYLGFSSSLVLILIACLLCLGWQTLIAFKNNDRIAFVPFIAIAFFLLQ